MWSSVLKECGRICALKEDGRWEKRADSPVGDKDSEVGKGGSCNTLVIVVRFGGLSQKQWLAIEDL